MGRREAVTGNPRGGRFAVAHTGFFAWVLALCASVASAEEPAEGTGDPADLEVLSLEGLMQVKVTAVSKREEPASSALGAVSTYSGGSLERYGYYTLSDVAEITPGYSTYHVFGERVLGTRGLKAGSFNNNKHLLLVDGVPLHHAKSYKLPTEYELPLYFAQQVEMVRGPSSTLYGPSAFLGVVSVTPKSLQADGTMLEGKVSLGLPAHRLATQPWEFRRRVMANALHREGSHELALSVGYFAKRPSERVAGGTGDDRPALYVAPANSVSWDDQQSMFLRVADRVVGGPFEGLTMGVLLLDKSGGGGEFWNADLFSHEGNQLRWTILQPYLRYVRRFRSSLELRAYARYNQSREQGQSIAPAPSATDSPSVTLYDHWTNDVEVNAELHYDPLESLHFVFGATFDSRRLNAGGREGYAFRVGPSDDPSRLVPADELRESERVNTASAYSEGALQLDVLSGLWFTLGARMDVGFTGHENYQQLSPRGGFVLKPIDALALRGSYTSALRSPGIKEFSLNEEARRSLAERGSDVDGLASLSAETIQSAEGGVAVETSWVVAHAAGFFTHTRRPLDGVIFMDENVFVNGSSHVTVVGFESEIKVPVTPQLPVTLNATWARGRDDDGNDVPDVPVAQLNAGVGYSVPQWAALRAHAWLKWVSGYRVPASEAPPYPGHVALDVNVIVSVAPRFDLELMVSNLTGARYDYPYAGLPRAPSAPRAMLLTLSQRME